MNLDTIASKIIHYTFYALFFIVPLIFLRGNFELFQFNKMFTVYFATTIIAAAWLIKMILQRRFFVRKTPFDIPILLFLGSQIASTLFSIEPHTSLWGYYSRFHGGLLSTISYILLYYAFVSNLSSFHSNTSSKREGRENISASLLILLTSATIVAIYGILEHFGIDAKYWVQDVRNRVFSTLGQPNWLAAFLVTVTPLTFIPLLNKESVVKSARGANFARRLGQAIGLASRSTKGRPRTTTVSDQKIAALRAIPTSVSYILLAIFYLTLLYTKSRSGLLGFTLMYAVYWGLLLLIRKRHSSVKQFVKTSALILSITLLVGTPFTPSLSQIAKRLTTQPLRAPQPASQEAPKLPVGGTPSEEIRRIVWKGAIDVWRHWPIFGSGVETFAYSYYNFRPVEHNFVSEWDFLYNKAHNEYLNFLATTGSVGLGSYLLLQGWFAIWSLKQIFKNKVLLITHYSLLISLLAGYSGLAVTNFFGFSTVTTGLLFFMFPAFAVASTQELPRWRLLRLGAKKQKEKLTFTQTVSITLVLFLFLYLFSQVGKRWYADRLFAQGKGLSDSNRMSEGLILLQRAYALVPDEPLFHDRLALDFARSAVALHLSGEATSAAQFAELSAAHSDLTILQNPVHLNYLKNRAATMIHLASIDPTYRKFAQEALQRAAQLAPTDPKTAYNLGLFYQQQDEPERALEELERAIALKPDYELTRVALASLYEKLGQPEKAIQQYEAILEFKSGDPTATRALERLATKSSTMRNE